MMSVIVLSVIMLSFITMLVIMLSVIVLSFITMRVIMLSVNLSCHYAECQFVMSLC
jgi:hypothetical protein